MDYIKAKKSICSFIIENNYEVGDKIPSIQKLSQQLKIGKISVQNAVKLLEQEGILDNIPRSGCYVKRIPESKLDDEASVKHSNGNGFFTADFINDPRKRIRIGIIASDLSTFPHLWKKIFLDYMKKHPDVNIELIPFSEYSLLTNHDDDFPDIVQIPASFLGIFTRLDRLFNILELGKNIFDLSVFYPGIAQGIQLAGGLWGAPLVCAGSCFCYNKKYTSLIKDLNCQDGFWKCLKSAKKIKNKGFESVINFDKSPFSLMKMAVNRENYDYESMKYFEGDDFTEMLKKFEPYFRNPQVTAPFFVNAPTVHESTVNSFYSGISATAMWSSSGLPVHLTECPFELGLLPVPAEPSCSCDMETALNCITNSSRYPLECTEILKYLCSFEVQKFFASEGRMVARNDANQYLKIKGIDDEFIEDLLSCLQIGKIELNNSNQVAEFTHTVVFYEMKAWQQGKINADDFIDQLRLKAKFFFKERNGKNEKNNAKISYA